MYNHVKNSQSMKKRITIFFLLLFLAITASAQLMVNYTGQVGINTSPNANSLLKVGSYTAGNARVGITSSPVVANMNNIGVEGAVDDNSSYTSNTNYGVIGFVDSINSVHGRNYGVCGMIGYPTVGTFYGGTGVYATHSTYFYVYPTNIQGFYAGYFVGPVYVSGNMTVPSMFTSTDSRLSNNLVSLNERDNNGKATLKNVLNMNVVEYNLKSRLNEMPDDIAPEKAEKVKKSYDYLKKKDEEMASRRHFGINAEELQKLYPDLVLEGQDGYLSVNYSELVPLLIRSIQVLKQELDEVKSTRPKARKSASSTEINASSVSGNILYQNTPNPFKEQTIIRFKLAEEVKDASICIFDMKGKLLKKLPISSGMESVSIGGYELGEGMFLYSLIVNGLEIDTKKMVIQ